MQIYQIEFKRVQIFFLDPSLSFTPSRFQYTVEKESPWGFCIANDKKVARMIMSRVISHGDLNFSHYKFL